jgi:ABC-2 type transport system ATP-binding protein
LTVAAAKRPELLIFDEPAAALDPLARKGFLRGLVDFVGELGASAVLSSHLLSDVEQVCDYLVVLCDSRVQVAGPVRELLASHHRIAGDPAAPAAGSEVIWTEHGRALVRGGVAGGAGEPITLEELVLAYMSRAAVPGAGARDDAAVSR